MDVLTRMLNKATCFGLVKGPCHDVLPGGLLIYADGTILFVDSDPNLAVNMK